MIVTTVHSQSQRRVPIFLYIVLLILLSSTTESTKNLNHDRTRSKHGNHLDVQDNLHLTRKNEEASKNKDGKMDKETEDRALDRFLENVLKAKNELRWIDQAVRNAKSEDNPWKSSLRVARGEREYSGSPTREKRSSQGNIDYGNKLRDKRGFDRSYEATWLPHKKRYRDGDAVRAPRRVYSDKDTVYKRDIDRVDFDGLDPSQNRVNGMEIHSSPERRLDRPVYEKGAMDDQPLKDWPRAEDLRSTGDRLNSNKNLEPVEDKREDRWIRAYETASKNIEPKERKTKEAPSSLKSIRKTVLELKKDLMEGDEKFHGNVDVEMKDIDSGHVDDEPDDEKSRGKEHSHLGNLRKKSSWSEMRPTRDTFDFKNGEEELEDGEKLWRTRRIEINNDLEDGNSRLFRGMGFGERYLEEKNVKEPYDRERRSKETSTLEKNVPCEQHEKEPSSSDSGVGGLFECEDRSKDESPKGGGIFGSRKIDSSRNNENGERSDLSFEDLSTTWRNKSNVERSMRNEEKDENLGGNSLQTSGSTRNELQTTSTKTTASTETEGGSGDAWAQRTEERQENVGSSQREQVIKVFEPQGHLYQNSARTKEVERIEADEKERRKLSQQMSVEKRNVGVPRNINILVKSENKNSIEFRNDHGGARALEDPSKNPASSVLNELDVKKKLIMETEEKKGTGKSVSAIFDVEIQKARVETSVGDGKNSTVTRNFGGRKFEIDGDGDGEGTAHGKNKSNEELFRDTGGFTKDRGQRDVNDERLENSAEFNKGLTQSVDDEGSQNWYEDAVRNQMGINIDQSTAGSRNDAKYKKGGEKERFRSDETQFPDDKKKAGSIDDFNAAERDGRPSGFPDGTRNWGRDDKSREEFTNNDNKDPMNDERSTVPRNKNEAYARRRRRRLLQQDKSDVDERVDDRGYSNDETRDVSTSENEEEDEDDEEDEIPEVMEDPEFEREGRSAQSGRVDPVKAKVDMLIKQKIHAKKGNGYYTRTRRNPIEYYEYGGDVEQQEPLINSEQQKIESSEDSNFQSRTSLGNADGSGACDSPVVKKNEQAEAVRRNEREKAKSKNKGPKEGFIVDLGQPRRKNVTGKNGKSSNLSRSSSKVKSGEHQEFLWRQEPGRLSQGEDNVAGINRGRSTELLEEGETLQGEREKGSEDKGKVIVEKPEEYVLDVRGKLEPENVDDFLGELQSIGLLGNEKIQTPKGVYNDLNGESRNENHYYSGNVEKKPNDAVPLYEERRKIYGWNDGELKNKPRLKGDPRVYHETDELDELIGSDKYDDSEVSRKKEQGRSLGEKIEPETQIAGVVPEDSVMERKYPEATCNAEVTGTKVIEGKKSTVGKKDVAKRSLMDQKQYINTDSRSPYENRKFLDSRLPREQIRNVDRGEQTAISSMDLHESFVEPLEWIDDLDNDIRVRLGRGLKSMERTISNSDKNMGEKVFFNLTNNIQNSETTSASERLAEMHEDEMYPTGKSKTNSSVYLSSKIINPASRRLNEKINSRVRRDVSSPYRTFYDDGNQKQRDADEIDYGGGSRNERKIYDRSRLPSSYENVDRNNHNSLDLYWHNFPLEDGRSLDEHRKIIRSATTKKKTRGKKNKPKHSGKSKHFKKHKRKGQVAASKYARSNNPRNRRHHKHSAKKKHDVRKVVKKNKTKNKSREKNIHGTRQAHPKYQSALIETKVHSESAVDQSTRRPEEDLQRKKMMVLLTTDNMEDESQMDSALHGELADKIVEQIFEEVQKNEDLKVSLGPGLYRKHKSENTETKGKMHRRSQDDDEVKHTEELMKKVMELLNRLILNEVQRKTCVSLPPDLREFLDWMLDVERQENSLEQAPPLPLVHEKNISKHRPQDVFLFRTSTDEEMETDINELNKKVRVIQNLISEYNALTDKEKTKVHTVHDYLIKQLDALLTYIESKEEAENKMRTSSGVGAARKIDGSILRYQSATSNATNGNYSMAKDTFSSLIDNMPSFFKLSNASNDADAVDFRNNLIDPRRRRRRKIRSSDRGPKKHERRKKRKRKKDRRRKHGREIHRSSRKKNSVHGVKTSRRKRAYSDKDLWDPFDSGYEEPLTYGYIDMTNINSWDEKIRGKKGETRRIVRSSTVSTENTRGEIKRDITSPAVPVEENNFGTEFAKKYFDEAAARSSEMKYESTTVKGTQGLLTSRGSLIINDKERNVLPIKGKNRLEDEVILLNKREAWKRENEEQLEEVAFGKDMRKKLKERELFEKLTEIDKKKNIQPVDIVVENIQDKSTTSRRNFEEASNTINGSSTMDQMNSYVSSSEDKLRQLEERINVYP